jgi:flagellar hook assembly protein FlgD
VRLRTSDKAGNLATATVTVTVSNFKLTQNVLQINAPGGEAITYTSIVPFSMDETIFLKNEAGQIVRTLFSGSRAAGSYNDVWDGKGTTNQYLPIGGYFVIATVTVGSSTLIWDRSGVYLNDYTFDMKYPNLQQVGTFDSLNNQPLTFTYIPGQASRITVFLDPAFQSPSYTCAPPEYCVVNSRYEESGTHTLRWAGVDSTGALRPELQYITAVALRNLFPKNAVVVYGTRPSVSNFTVTPVRVVSGSSLTVAFDLSTFQSAPANLAMTFQNQASLSVLRTIPLPNQTPGHVSVSWDSRADNGMLVTPGRYVVTLSGQDAVGNPISSQSIATVDF